jgi:hypothetical protein
MRRIAPLNRRLFGKNFGLPERLRPGDERVAAKPAGKARLD